MCFNINRLKIIILSLAAALLLAGCGSIVKIELPPLPTPTEAPTPTPVPTYVPKVTPTPEPTPEPEASPEVSAAPTPTPVSIPTPAATPKHTGPAITVENMTLPENMLQYNVVSLLGWIYTDRGIITDVYASITDDKGSIVQDSHYSPYETKFGLAGTVNADLAFAVLTPGSYTYQITVTAQDGAESTMETIASQPFTVYSEKDASKLYSHDIDNYTAKATTETSNEALIWNYFVGKLNNPIGAAAVLANIEVESLCTPNRVAGDTSETLTVSKQYTEEVDNGNYSREYFISAKAISEYGNGYGLCQWSGDRKAGLYDLAKSKGVSVGDLTMQCDYIMQEMTDSYPALLEFLMNAQDYAAATREFCYIFEQAEVVGSRTVFAKSYLDKYAA